MRDYTMNLNKRYFFSDVEGAETAVAIAGDMFVAADKYPDIDFGLNSTYIGFKNDSEYINTIKRLFSKTDNLLFSAELPVNNSNSGPGYALDRNLFSYGITEFDRTYDFTVTMDGDQFSFFKYDLPEPDLSESETIELIRSVAERLDEKDAVLGQIFRDNIYLGNGKIGDYRKIHELLITSMITHSFDVENPLGIEMESGYNEIYDGFPGCYIINWNASGFSELLTWINNARRKYPGIFNHHAIDYSVIPYVGLNPDKFGKIQAAIISSDKNEDTENTSSFEHVKNKIIKEQTANVMKTDVGPYLKDHLKNPETIRRVAEFYPEEDVNTVADFMLGLA